MRRLLLVSVLLCFGLCGCGDQSSTDPRVREILSAPVPEGINPVVWRELTEKLAAVVESRRTSIPPTNSASATTLTYDDANGVLHWPYYFSGDYDQNGVVSVSDLTPLAVNLGASVTDANSITGVIDGDGNGEITVADLTPIGVNLGKTVQGYRVYSASSADPYPATPTAPNGAGTQLAGTVLLAEATGDKGTQRLQFSFDPPAPAVQTWYWVRPFDGSDDGTPSSLVMIAPGGNPAPFAALSASPDTGATPLRVQLIASASHDEAPGQIVKYEWDLDGDGDFEYDSGITDNTPMWYYAPGTFSAAVRVTDDTGLSSVQDVEVEVTLGKSWQIQTVVEEATEYSGALNCGGRLGLFYSDFIESTTKAHAEFKRAANSAATGWGQEIELFDGTHISTQSVALIGDKPAAASFQLSDGQGNLIQKIRYRVAEDATASAWSSTLLESSLNLAGYSGAMSLAEVAGTPRLALLRSTSGSPPIYFSSGDEAGAAWTEFLPITSHGSEFHLRSIAGLPGLAYRVSYQGVEALAYTSSPTVDGDSWRVPVILDYVGVAGKQPRLIELSGKPAVLYHDQVFEAVKLIQARDALGKEWNAPQVLGRNSRGSQSMALLPDGRLAVVFLKTNGDLSFIAANEPKAVSWSLAQTIDTNVLQSLSAEFGPVLIDANMFVAYQDSTNIGPFQLHAIKVAGYN